VAAVALFVNRVGGIKNAMKLVGEWSAKAWSTVKEWAGIAWDWIQTKFNAFMEWSAPIWRAMAGLAVAVWQLIKQGALLAWEAIKTAATYLWTFLSSMWVSVFGDAEINWSKIKDAIVDSILFAEYTLSNFGRVAEYVWAGMKYHAVAAANWLLQNVFLVMMGPGGWMVALLMSLNINWQATFKAMWDYTVAMFTSISDMAGQLGARILRALTGRGAGAALNIGNALQGIELTFRGVNLPSLQRLENSLRAEFNRLGTELGEDFAAFRARRMAELGVTPEDEVAAENAGRTIGNSFARGMGKPLEKLDAALYGSMEAVARFITYRDKVMNPSERPTPSLGSERAETVSPILHRIAMATERMAARPPVLIEGAGL
jgi:hypothetical protein